ncbi:hypothetical protein CPB86DRAFT_757230 [Serendipita vermifera]|nr:hypothetical protein CPB86DRAFT_757230 [Serendipita vermifera]
MGNHPERPVILNNLAMDLIKRYEVTGNEQNEAEGLAILHTAIDMTPHGHPFRAALWSNLSAGFIGRFRRLGLMEYIERAIVLLEWSVQATPISHPSMSTRLGNLGAAFSLKCAKTRTLPDIEQAIATLQSAMGLIPNGDPRRPIIMGPLGVSHARRFEILDSLEDLNSGISALDVAVQLIPNGDPNKLAYMGELGLGLTRRFERLGELSDLDKAVSVLQFSADMTPDQHPEKPARVRNLCNALTKRFIRSENREDIEMSISRMQRALELVQDGNPKMPSICHCLSNLGMALCTRFELQLSRQDLEDAIKAFQMAVNLTHDGDRSMPKWLNNLSHSLLLRFELLEMEEDIERAVSSMQVAVALAHDGHSIKTGCLNLLGTTLLSRYKAYKRVEDAELGIKTLRTALSLTPRDHPNQPIILVKIGDIYVARYEHENKVESLDQALEAFLHAAKSPTGSPTQRFHAAVRWARCERFLSKPPLDAFRYALEFLPRIAWIGLSVGDQHSLLANIGFIVREAVSSAIQFGEYETAVEWTEQGRSIVWQHVLNLRTPVDELRKTHPELADRFWAISREIQDPIEQDIASTRTETSQPEWIASRRRELSIEWDKLIEEIRRVPNFNTFLRAKYFEELSNVAQDGPVVILNADEFRCDALILILNGGRTSVNHVPLKTLSYKTCVQLFEKLKTLLSRAGVRTRNLRVHEWVMASPSEEDFKNILGILWKHVAKPIIDSLEYQEAHIYVDPPHIWWCATGPLAFLPIHAAGLYDEVDPGNKLSDYVVSSYCPTLSSLGEPSKQPNQEPFKILTVAQPATPNASPIPQTEDEVRLIQQIASGFQISNLTREDATVEKVLRAMQDSNWVHLACHGQQCVGSAMDSGILLQDGILKLSTVVRAHLPKAQFAFLSACQTAMGDESVSEESAHLAAGMLLAGYRGVVATMWSIGDNDAPRIAEEVYRRVLKGGQPNWKGAARALHEGVKTLRESGAGFISWVPFIHIGR